MIIGNCQSPYLSVHFTMVLEASVQVSQFRDVLFGLYIHHSRVEAFSWRLRVSSIWIITTGFIEIEMHKAKAMISVLHAAVLDCFYSGELVLRHIVNKT